MNKSIKYIELFAGCGGFRVGLERASNLFDSVWSNQWEPNKKKQFVWECYENNYGEGICVNEDIHNVSSNNIPDFDLLTAGFPCQDYSVAKSLKYSGGIEGKKGVLWWQIDRIIKDKKPKYVLLENVDRLIKSPANQRGRDFSIILSCLMNSGYSVEWKIINAANYGMPQKRKRLFIFARKDNKQNKILKDTFPHEELNNITFEIGNDILELSENFVINKNKQFFEYGSASNFNITTSKVNDTYDGDYTLLGDIVEDIDNVDDTFFINNLEKWQELKGGRKINRVSKSGHAYVYSEGKMSFPDSLEKPGRTIITGEGGKSPSRFKHVIEQNNILRRLTPVELERLQMFPDNHTEGFTDTQRAFMMGNALVTGVVEKIGVELIKQENNY